MPLSALPPTTRGSVRVAVDVCSRCADLIAGWSVPPDREEVRLANLSSRQVGNFFFLLVSICHQTSTPGVPPLEGVVDGRYRRGWDYLEARLETEVRADETLLSPLTWATLTPSHLESIFRDDKYGSRLTHLAGRSELIQDLGQRMKGFGWLWVDTMYESAGHRVDTGATSLLQLLSTFTAYSDPVKKKSSFFLSLMRNSGIWSYVDDETLGPPVDYHEVRGHLRIGTVRIVDQGLREKIFNRQPVDYSEDIAIRSCVYDAIMMISRGRGMHSPSQLHYLFWNIFRSCCRRENPHCRACGAECDLPGQYVHLALQGDVRRCPFASICASANARKRYYEHVFETDYY